LVARKHKKLLNPLKKLAGQTALYGISSILGRSLNYLLVPLYTSQFLPEAFGVYTELYAYVGFLVVLLTYGMETALFRFANQEPDNKQVYSSALVSFLISSIAFAVIFTLASGPIATAMEYANHPEYITWFAWILALDALSALPFARLRLQNKPFRFAMVRLVSIGVNVGLNLFFLYFAKNAFDAGETSWSASCYDPSIGVGYIFIINLISSIVTLVLLLPAFRGLSAGFSAKTWKRMMRYGMPLVVVGFAGIINETLDRALMKYLLPFDHETNMYQLGIYGANYKLAMLMTIFIQAYRYAAEPFFFSQAKEKDSKLLFAQILNYFALAGAFIFLLVTLFIDVFKWFIRNPEFHEGLNVVPILLMANLFFGLYISLSIWYKLSDKTGLGGWVALSAAALTIALNVWWIPIYGYTGSAWATLIVYVYLATVSLILGNKYYPVPYQVGRIAIYILVAAAIYLLDYNFTHLIPVNAYMIKGGYLVGYGLFAYLMERERKVI
jgi:O-antigen/teichoic acid export membrane protein